MAGFSLFITLFGIALAQQCQELDPAQRLPCWSWYKYDFSEEKCLERGCCWSPTFLTNNWCYYSHAKEEITDVHVVQGSHVDLGFMKPAPDIINMWFHEHFPRAYQIGKELEAMGNKTKAGMKFTAQSYLISLFFDCPADYFGVICPTQAQKDQVTEAIQKGWLTWHAFPFNAEMEAMDESLIEFGLTLTHDLDKKFNKPLKTVLSQRDVPGMTVNTIPILKRNGITAISVGVNGGSTPPDTAASFLWKNHLTGDSMRTFYVQGGYSGWSGLFPWDKYTWTGVPGSSHIMVITWRGDNAGPPPNASDILDDWAAIAIEFPRANIFSSTFDEFVAAVQNIPDENFPLIEQEIGDSWIHGIASDPVKLAKMRIIQEERTRCVKEKACDLTDSLNGEHTWGLDNKMTLTSYIDSHWTNKDLDMIKTTDQGKRIVESWNRQRAMGIDFALTALKDHPLHAKITKRLETAMKVQTPNVDGFTSFPPSKLPEFFQVGSNVKVGFDSTTGAINYFSKSENRIATPSNPLLLLEYQTYSGRDFENFMLHYNYLFILYPMDDYYDFDKVNIESGGAEHREVHSKLEKFWVKSSPNVTEFVLQLSFPSELAIVAGTPQSVWIPIKAFSNGTIDFSVRLFNKTSTRLPEAFFLRFLPKDSTPQGMNWDMHKLTGSVDPSTVITGGGKHMHAISKFIRYQTAKTNLTISPVHSPLVNFGEPTAFPTPTDMEPNWAQGASFILYDNIWNTNYIMWYPFNRDEVDLISDYRLDCQ